MKKKKDQPQDFPKISRLITEKKEIPIFLLTIALMLFVLFMLFDLRQKINMTYSLETERKQVLNEIKQWEDVIKKHPDYNEGYLYLSGLEHRLGNFEKTQIYLNNVLLINPNSKQGRGLEEELSRYY